MKIVKRDGHIVDYNPEKIRIAIQKANAEVGRNEKVTSDEIEQIIKYIEELDKKRILVEDIQDIIEEKLMEFGRFQLAKKYITYRYTRELVRKANTTDQNIKELIEGGNESWNSGNANGNTTNVMGQRNYLASITSSDITKRFLLSEEVSKSHEEGLIHFHGTEYFAQNAIHDSEWINLEDMLQNGTDINGIKIEKPKSFIEAVFITLQIINEVSSSSSGNVTFSLAHIAPFVKDSYNNHHDKYKRVVLTKEECQKLAKIDTQKEIAKGIKLLNYGLNSMLNIYGKGSASYVCIDLNETQEYKKEYLSVVEEFLKQKLEILKGNQKDSYVYPRVIYVLREDNNKEGCKYWDLTKLVNECNAIENVTEIITEEKKQNVYGKFNQGTVTINLLDVAISSEKNINEFWNILQERLEICHKALQIRHKRLSNVKSDMAPILWQYGAIARLEKGKSIHELLHHGYSTLSLGYSGLFECVKYLSEDLSDEEKQKLRTDILDCINKIKSKWVEEEDIEYILCGIETKAITQKFARCMQDKYGKIKDITDKEYITN